MVIIGAACPARTAGGLAEEVCAARTAGGLAEVPVGSFVAGAACPARAVGGLAEEAGDSFQRDLLAEVRLDDARIVGDLARPPLGDLLAVVQHDDAIHHAHERGHDVLDPDDRDAELAADAAQHVGGARHLRWIEAAEALVGQEQPRRRGQRAGQLELLQPACAEQRGHGVGFGRQSHERQHVTRAGSRARLRGAAAVVGGDGDVVDDRELAKGPRDLERSRDPAVTDRVRREAAHLDVIEADAAGRRRQRARDAVEAGGLPRAVGADETEDLALPDVEGHGVQSREASELLGERVDREQGRGAVTGARAPRQRDRNGEDVGSRTGGLVRLAITGGYTCLNSPSTTWKTAAKARMFWPAIGCPAGWNLTPYPCIVPPSGMSVSRAALASASGPKPPCFWMARGTTSFRRIQMLLKPIETCGAICPGGMVGSNAL